MANSSSVVEAPSAPRTTSSARQHPYAVWAPDAEQLVLALGGEHLPMTRDATGWWTADRPMRLGDRYGYLVNGEGPFPDPRSRYQPDGVHGLSQWIDHEGFAWSDQGWQAVPLAAGVIYELHIGTFSEAGTV